MAKHQGARRRKREKTVRVGSIRGNPSSPPSTPMVQRAPKPVPSGEDDASPTPGLTVVGVGASAGGLDAFSQMLEPLKPDGSLAIVFVQHLSPQHESALPALLSAKTSFRVVQVTDHLRVEANHVYVIPPNVQITLTDGELRLAPRPHDRSQFTPIDVFFQSLAITKQDRAIGVILSGTASDGAAGLREIKAHGGITMAQKPETARYDSMPRAAIATGTVDLVLMPREMADHIVQVQKHPYLRYTSDEQAVSPNDFQFAEIFAMLRRISGVDFKHYKLPTLRRRLLRRMALHRLSNVAAYVRLLREDQREGKALYHDLLIHVTRFFREPDSFASLQHHVFPEIVANHGPDEPIRIWVPGCATGEEVYSIGIAMLEFLGERVSERRLQLFATDVSEAAIEQARLGVYPLSIVADVSAERLRRFFSKSDGGYKVNKILRDMCVFARHDLTRDPPFSRLSLIVCRNVLIYLDVPSQKRLISVFHYALKPHGFLMLGPAETTGHQPFFTIIEKQWRLYQRAQSNVTPLMDFSASRPADADAFLPAAKRDLARLPTRPPHDEATRVLLERYSPPGVVVDANNQIVQFRGKTGAFLEAPTGDPSLNLLKMAREGLVHPLKTALQTARRKRQAVRKDGVHFRRNGGEWRELGLEVIPLSGPRSDQMLVVFDVPSQGKSKRTVTLPTKGPGKRETDERVANLTHELEASREYLQSMIQELEAANEEMQSANEEILSSNEELQSTNEELDTAKEELQSTNEELNTVNEELHSRNEELTRVNSDLVNLLASVDITIVIISEDMRIRRFTPMAEQVLNLIATDVGRPIGQLKPNINRDDLEELIRQTIDTVTPCEREVQDRKGHWYSLRIRPYKSVDNRLDGAVIALIDIDSAKRYQEQIERGRDYFLAIVDTVRQPLLVLDKEMRVRTTNKAFCESYNVAADTVVGKRIEDLGDHQWNDPKLREALAQVKSQRIIKDFIIEQDGSGKPRRRVMVNARRLDLDDAEHWILLSLEDITASAAGAVTR